MQKKHKKPPLSQAEYARHRECSSETVRRAIQSGRLERSLVMVGKRPKIIDAEMADGEWKSNTRPRIDELCKREARKATPAPPADPMRDPNVITSKLAIYAMAHAALDICGRHQAEKLAETAKAFFKMPDVSEVIDEEIADVLNPYEDDDE